MNALSFNDIAERTKIEPGLLIEVLSSEVGCGHVLIVGDGYRLAADFEARFGRALRGMGDREGEQERPVALHERVLEQLGCYRSGLRVVEVAQAIGAARGDVRAELHRLVEAGIVVRRDGMNKARVYSLASPAEQAA